jgi:hypothetical protein
MKVVQIVACVYVAWTKTFCMAVILLYICVYPVDIVKVTHFQLKNFRIFVDFGILPGFFRWFRADVVESVAGSDSLLFRIYGAHKYI